MEAIFLEQEADQEFISRKIYRYEVYIIKYIRIYIYIYIYIYNIYIYVCIYEVVFLHEF